MGNWFSSGNKPWYGWFKRQPVIAPPVTTNLTGPNGNNNSNSVSAVYGPREPNFYTSISNSNRSVNLRKPLIGPGNPQPPVNSSISNRNRSVNLRKQLIGPGNPQPVVNSSNSNNVNDRRVNISRRPSTGTTYSVVSEPELDGGSRSKKNKNRRKFKRTRKNHKKGL